MGKNGKTNGAEMVINDATILPNFTMKVLLKTSLNAENKANGETEEQEVNFHFNGFTFADVKNALVGGVSPRVSYQSVCRRTGTFPKDYDVPKVNARSNELTKSDIRAIEKLKKRYPERAAEFDEMMKK